MKIRQEDIQKHLPFICIFIFAVFFRFYLIQDFQFDSDELSAIFRAEQSKTWQQHIDHGIIVDGHPAGIQTLIWIWIKLFPYDALSLKAFWAIFSLINLVFIYSISRKLFSLKSAIFATTLMSLLWWQVDMSLWVRPYIFGQLFTLWVFYALQFETPNAPSVNFIQLSLAMAGSFYTHHFSTLTTVVLVTTAFLIFPRKRKFILSAVGIFILLAIPQFDILRLQLKNQGLDWLGKPSSHFFSSHVLFIFNNSVILLSFTLITVIIGIFYMKLQNRAINHWKLSILLGFISFVPAFIGFVYSIFFKPVLQNNVLFFSFPILIISLSCWYQNLPKKPFALLQMFFILLLIFQLVYTKKRYNVEIKDVFASQMNFLNSHFIGSVGIIDGPTDVFNYHLKQHHQNLKQIDTFNYWNISKYGYNYKKLNAMIHHFNSKNDIHLITNAGSPPELRPILYYFFPQNSFHSYFIGGQIDLLKSKHLPIKNGYFLSSFPLMKLETITLKVNTNAQVKFGPNVEPNDLFFIALDIPKSCHDIQIVTTITNKQDLFGESTEEQIDWRSSNCENYSKAGFTKSFHAVKLSDIPGWNKNSILSVRIESRIPHKETYKLELFQFKGNPYQYGIQ